MGSDNKFDSVESAIEDIRRGKIIIVSDDEDRENEGDFIMAADRVTPEAINFMATHGRGLICTPITKNLAKSLNLDLMAKSNDSAHYTSFTVSIDHKDAGTGISCADRSLSILKMLDSKTSPSDFLRPGHIFPLIARDGGVLKRPGHTEAAVDLARIAGCHPSGVICEIMNDDGSMARRDDLFKIAKKHDLKFITIKDLIEYRRKANDRIEGQAIPFPNKYGDFKFQLFVDDNKLEHFAVFKGDIKDKEDVLVRVHSECITGDVFGSQRCDCGPQLENSMKLIEEKGAGILIYLRQEGRGIGLTNKIKAYQLQDEGLDTFEANNELGLDDDLRDYDMALEILSRFNVKSIGLLTNNPKKIEQLKLGDLKSVNRHPIEVAPNEKNINYLRAKKEKHQHMLSNITK